MIWYACVGRIAVRLDGLVSLDGIPADDLTGCEWSDMDACVSVEDAPDEADEPPPEAGLAAVLSLPVSTVAYAPVGCRVETRTADAVISWPLARGGESRSKRKQGATVPAWSAGLFARVRDVRAWWELLGAVRLVEWLCEKAGERGGEWSCRLRPRTMRRLCVLTGGCVVVSVPGVRLERDGDRVAVRRLAA
jgi:hypothetical protein